MPESFGEALRRYRLAASLTQEALAERAAMSPTSVAALERGRSRAPRLTTLRQIARALDLEPEELAELATLSRVSDAQPSVTVGPDSATRATLSGLPALVRQWRTEFVGRESELDRLRSACAGRCRLVEVIGEPGIGKTRLVGELARHAHRDGSTVLWGRCTEERLGAYQPFVEVLRQLISEADPDLLSAAVAGRGELTRLVPEITEIVGPLPAPTKAEAGTEQRLLFEAVAALLCQWSPLMVVIDDLHWTDDASLSLVGYLLRDGDLTGLTVVATTRASDLSTAHAGILADLSRHARGIRLQLAGFTHEDLTSLLSDLVGLRVTPGLVESVGSATEGNPFFAEEMVIHLNDSGLLRDAGDGLELREGGATIGVPDRVRDTLLRRFASLPRDSVELLSVGAVMGREFEVAVAAAASGLEGPRVLDAVDIGLLSGLVVETVPGCVAFSHALVQQTVSDRISDLRKAGVHRRVAEEVEARWAHAPALVAAELARHWSAVAAVDPSARSTAATWAVRAGDVAVAAAASEEAIARYEEATWLWSAGTAGHADALIRLGEALQHRGRADEADRRFRQGLQLAIVIGEPRLQARAATGLGRRYPYWETDSDRIAALERALVALSPDDSVMRLTVMGFLVTHLINGFHPEEAGRRDALADELGKIAATATDPDVLMALGQTRIYDCIESPPVLDGVAGRLARLAEERSELRVLAGARFAQGLAALDAGDMARLHWASGEYSAAAGRLDDPREKSQAAMVRSTIAFIEGRYADAQTLSDDALTLGKASGDFNAELVNYAQGLLRGVDTGLAEVILPLLLEATEYQQIAGFSAGTALVAALAGDRSVAGETLDRLMVSGFDSKPRGADWLSSTSFLAHTCAIISASEHAGELLELLGRAQTGIVRVGPLIGWWGPVDHHRGALCRLLGRVDQAEEHLRRALDVEESMGALPFAARTRAELASLLLGRDPISARALLDDALAGARSIGAAGIVNEINGVFEGARSELAG